MVDALLAPAMTSSWSTCSTRRPTAACLSPRQRADWRFADLNDATATRAAVEGVDAVCHQAARVGLGVDFGDVDAYVIDNDLGTAVLLRALHDAGFGGRFVLASSMVVYGEGRYHCAEHGVVRPGPRRRIDLDAGCYEPPCPACGALGARLLVDETRRSPADAATKLRRASGGRLRAPATARSPPCATWCVRAGCRDTPYAAWPACSAALGRPAARGAGGRRAAA